MKLSELKSIIIECIEEMQLNEKAPHRKHLGYNGRENTQKRDADDVFSNTSGHSVKPVTNKHGKTFKYTDENGKLHSSIVGNKKFLTKLSISKNKQIRPKLPKDR